MYRAGPTSHAGPDALAPSPDPVQCHVCVHIGAAQENVLVTQGAITHAGVLRKKKEGGKETKTSGGADWTLMCRFCVDRVVEQRTTMEKNKSRKSASSSEEGEGRKERDVVEVLDSLPIKELRQVVMDASEVTKGATIRQFAQDARRIQDLAKEASLHEHVARRVALDTEGKCEATNGELAEEHRETASELKEESEKQTAATLGTNHKNTHTHSQPSFAARASHMLVCGFRLLG